MHLKRILYTGVITLCFLTTACQPAALPAVTPTAQSTIPAITPTPPPPPTRTLTIGLGQEPQSLFIYGTQSRAMSSVLEAVYDGPIDTINYQPKPVILTTFPSVDNGDVTVQSVEVKEGDLVIDSSGKLVNLVKDVQVMPSGCTGADCAETWDGSKPVKMDQQVVKFHLKDGITWSDGQALSAADSVYSFQLASDAAVMTSKYSLQRTAAYTALDNSTVQWMGVPGFTDNHYETYFWSPLPKHVMELKKTADLLTADETNRTPLGWGAYIIKEWVTGDHIRLVKNTNYFRASEGLPKFDVLVYRFLGSDANSNLEALLTGECDVIDQSSLLDQQLSAILDLEKNHKLNLLSSQGPEWEHVDFGIQSAPSDPSQALANPTKPSFFTDIRVRQAFAYCMNRQGAVDQLLHGKSSVPVGYYPEGNPLYVSDLSAITYDPTKGAALLEEAGWRDADNNPATPRQAIGAQGVPDGTELLVNYLVSTAPLESAVAKYLAESMAGCGIRVNVQPTNADELFAPGPAGKVFGRQFDMVQFAWAAGSQPPCGLFTSDQIPTDANHWVGTNVAGFSEHQFDKACLAVETNGIGADGAASANQAVQKLFASDLPVLPLYFAPKISVSRPDFCGLVMDPSAKDEFFNLETLDTGTSCPK
jgi:peptide/nickel transport system substrate-binding protein